MPTPSFFDLGTLSRASTPVAGPLVRSPLDLAPGPAEAGILRVEPGRHREAVASDEFVIVCAGEVSLSTADGSRRLASGQAAVVRAGSVVEWTCAARAALAYMRYARTNEAPGGILPIDAAPPLAPSGAPLAELLTTPTPQCRSFNDYVSADGEFMCGTWDSTPYARRAMRYRHHELMHLLDGEVTFEDAAGARATFVRGDTFLVRRDAECSWDSPVYVRKIYAIWRPAA